MIWQPQPGQRVRLHYGKLWGQITAMQGKAGTVITRCGRRGGPGNVRVKLDDGQTVTVPRGNLAEAER